jgi:hypothetical protein
MATVSTTDQQFAREAAQLQNSFTSFAKSIPQMPLQEQWHACEQILEPPPPKVGGFLLHRSP